MRRTIEQAEREIVVLRDMLFRNVTALAAQIPFAPQDPDAETPFECMAATLDVLNEIRDEQRRDEDGWRGSAESRLEALKLANNMAICAAAIEPRDA